MQLTEQQFKNFWKKVKVTEGEGCWEWDAAMYSNGYGHFVVSGKDHLAHRLSFQLSVGEIPEGLVLRHTCDNRKCVRPEHLIPGTHSENLRDCVDRGRLNPGRHPGETNPAAILTAQDVREIRDLLKHKVFNQTTIAFKYRIGMSAISSIKHGHTWKGI